jgi:hypothetical protein
MATLKDWVCRDLQHMKNTLSSLLMGEKVYLGKVDITQRCIEEYEIQIRSLKSWLIELNCS